MIFALIPAAGTSRRMGRPKLALPLGGRTVLEWVIGALRQAEVEPILVVLGPHVPDLVAPAEAAGARVHRLGFETADMRATVEAGLLWLEERYHPGPGDFWLLVPADHPTLEAGIVRQLLHARQAQADATIVIPTYEGRRGHPALIAWSHVERVRRLPPGQGLNSYFRECSQETLEVPVNSPEILVDLDTPDDYEHLLRTFRSQGETSSCP
jgi:molybdenum cofactor cytidylyltransferase